MKTTITRAILNTCFFAGLLLCMLAYFDVLTK